MGAAERINPQDIIGNQYGKWTVVDYVEKKGPHHLFRCRCACGNERIIPLNNLKRGLSRSCGHCIKPQIIQEDNCFRYVCTNGGSFLFDVEDYETVVQHHWSVNKAGYFVCEDNGKRLYLHRMLLDVGEEMCVDHINGDKCDNRRSNLRISTQKQNTHNSALMRNNTSGYKGVSFHQQAGKYEAYVTVDY
ncbi:MAG: HNH endonuclease [Clostridiales bacterium]|nr:HNH endonuclease [Clostridiales bacterium]